MSDKENCENECVFERRTVESTDHTSRFVKEVDNYMKQFANLYVKRIEELSPILEKKILTKWGSDINLIPLAKLEEENGKRCAVIGTLYKHQVNKPSILQELTDEHQLLPSEPKKDYCSEDDQLFLENQTSRIKLSGYKVNVKEAVTGVVCAIIGVENEKSSFEVEDWCFSGCPLQRSISLEPGSTGKLVFISGLELASNPPNLALNLFLEWLGGLLGDENIQNEEASIVRIIIAGNSIKGSADHRLCKGHASGKAEDAAATKDATTGLNRFDTLLETIGSICCVSVMPGEFDITTLMMPQSAMHPGLFPKARRLNNIKGVMNPWIGKIADKIITGTSGQPIQNIQKVCGNDTSRPIYWLERSLNWRHLCPTAPDTIPCMPFYKSDPFILRECPDIYFVGNMEKFETKLYKGEENQTIRLICIPKFATTQSAVLVDIDTLETRLISFGSKCF